MTSWKPTRRQAIAAALAAVVFLAGIVGPRIAEHFSCVTEPQITRFVAEPVDPSGDTAQALEIVGFAEPLGIATNDIIWAVSVPLDFSGRVLPAGPDGHTALTTRPGFFSDAVAWVFDRNGNQTFTTFGSAGISVNDSGIVVSNHAEASRRHHVVSYEPDGTVIGCTRINDTIHNDEVYDATTLETTRDRRGRPVADALAGWDIDRPDWTTEPIATPAGILGAETNDTVVLRDTETGEIIWESSCDTDTGIPCPQRIGDRIIEPVYQHLGNNLASIGGFGPEAIRAADTDGHIVVIDLTNGEVLDRTTTAGRPISGPVVIGPNGTHAGASDDIYSVDADTGQLGLAADTDDQGRFSLNELTTPQTATTSDGHTVVLLSHTPIFALPDTYQVIP